MPNVHKLNPPKIERNPKSRPHTPYTEEAGNNYDRIFKKGKYAEPQEPICPICKGLEPAGTCVGCN